MTVPLLVGSIYAAWIVRASASQPCVRTTPAIRARLARGGAWAFARRGPRRFHFVRSDGRPSRRRPIELETVPLGEIPRGAIVLAEIGDGEWVYAVALIDDEADGKLFTRSTRP